MENKFFQLEVNNKPLVVEVANLAEQANGSVLVRYGDTLILATAVMAKEEKDLGYFPLTVDYEERYYAAGKIMGSRFIRRESRPSDEAIITARLIDRAIRPLFPENFLKEVQVVVTCLSWDRENDPDILGLLGASLALSLSDIPWQGPVSVLRVGKINNQFILNPTYEQREKSELDLVFAGIEENDGFLINMIEGELKEISEDTILSAYQFAEPELKKIITFQKKIIEKEGKKKIIVEEPGRELKLEEEMRSFLNDKLEKILFSSSLKSNEETKKTKLERREELNNLKNELFSYIEKKYPEKIKDVNEFFEKEVKRVVQENILKKEKRPDGRKLDELRPISCQVGLLPRTHGSGLFCRGETKTISILTLGSPGDVKLLEGMEIVGKKRFMHHYNFPPYSTGEVKPLRGPGRREIGHGMLAEKALLSLVPPFDEFPYTIRVVSEILSSNGSTSMASVSSTSLALMDAGVPIKNPAAGISIGLVTDKSTSWLNEKYKLLADIQGPEDHYGDMDFKIAGTKNGVTALQMDVKIKGINKEILKEALLLGKKCRLQILEEMTKVLPSSRTELSPFAPRVLILQINPEKIREVIGPGGRVINEIIEECGVSIDIEDTGKIFVTAEKEEAAKKAVAWIKNITREIKVGEVFQGKVKRILDFGAFVEILPGQEGLIHISKLSSRRIKKVEEVVRVGDVIPVKVINIDKQGRINLSLNRQDRKQKYKI